MFAKDLRYDLLFDIYGALLSERQSEIFSLYYEDDLSLSEIGEATGLSPQGVRDAIKKSEAKLLDYENRLHLAEKSARVQTQVEAASRLLEEISGNVGAEDAAKVEKVKALLSAITG